MRSVESWVRPLACGGVLILQLAFIAVASGQDAAPALAQGRDIVELPSMGRVIMVFLLIAGLAVAVAYALRRYSPNFARGLVQQGRLRVIDRATLNPGLRVHLIEADGERLVIAENRGGISILQLRAPAPTDNKSESP
jgi:flagellar biogenesis protein FliO